MTVDLTGQYDRPLDCFCDDDAGALSLHAVRPDSLEAWFDSLEPGQSRFLKALGFGASANSLALVPGPEGIALAVAGLGSKTGPLAYGAIPGLLPAGTVWRLVGAGANCADAVLGFGLGAYRFDQLKTAAKAPFARLVLPEGPDVGAAVAAVRAAWLVRDLVNLPANMLGPAALALVAKDVLGRRKRDNSAEYHIDVITGQRLRSLYPAVFSVSKGSVRDGAVVSMRWRGSASDDQSKFVSVCGKGVCFDTGGYSIKGADGMLRMKKDMAGAATALSLAGMIMEADLPLRLELRLGCVENSIGEDAMRPLDILKTRRGLTVEVGNTDAEGRLVLCDLLAEASDARPDVLIDFATLTGAARTALGPDIAAMFCNDDALSCMFAEAAAAEHDPVWRLPLWEGYNYWLDGVAADLNNVSGKAHAGAVTAALFLQRFVAPGISWSHFDVYGWNDQAGPGRPQGGEAQALRSAFRVISTIVHNRGRMFSS